MAQTTKTTRIRRQDPLAVSTLTRGIPRRHDASPQAPRRETNLLGRVLRKARKGQ